MVIGLTRLSSAIWLCLSISSAFADQPPALASDNHPIIDSLIYTRAQRLVEVYPGRRLNLFCTGTGSPTVIFESGQGDDFSAWGLVQPAVAAKTKTCAYDRAGFGYSDPIDRPNTAAHFVDDLHRMLGKAAIKPPYILVGHSLGGMYVRLYADHYPSEVAGLVLIDPSNEDQRIGYRKIAARQRTPEEWRIYMADYYDKRRECIAAAPAGFSPGTPVYKQCADEPDKHFSAAINNALQKRRSRAEYLTADLSEQENMFDASADQMRAAHRNYGDMPLILLAHSALERGDNETPEHYAAAKQLQYSLDQQLVSLSAQGIYRVIPNSTHDIQVDQPQAVSTAIFEVMAQIRRTKAPAH
jgi:pimeloyl-ACP methyl ester carboxylesterase